MRLPRALGSVLALLLVGSCATPPVIVNPGVHKGAAGLKNRALTVLAPSIEVVDALTDSVLPLPVRETEALAASIVQVACEVLDGPSLVCAGSADRMTPAATGELQRFVAESKRIVNEAHVVNWSDLLMTIAAGDSTRGVVVHYVRVSVRASEAWNPFGGAIAGGRANTHVITAIVECGSGRVVGRSDAWLWEKPDPRRRRFVGALRAVYKNIR